MSSDPMAMHEFEHAVLEALAKAVPGFRYAYTHSADFHTAMANRLRLMLIECELMTLGANAKRKDQQRQITWNMRESGKQMYFTQDDAAYDWYHKYKRPGENDG